MNLLYIVQYWPSLFETYMFREVGWMAARGHRVAVVSLGSASPAGFRPDAGGYVDPAAFGAADIPVLPIHHWQAISREEVVRQALAFARRHEIELIDAHFAREPAEVACDLHRASGLPFTVRMCGGDVHSRVSPRLPEIATEAAALCPVSRFLADALLGRRKLPRPVGGIPAPVSPAKLRVLPCNLSARFLAKHAMPQSDAAQVVGSIGRLVPPKRFPDLIAAVADLACDFPGLRLRIIGGGDLMPALWAQAARRGVADRVDITGFKTWDDVMSLLGGVHVYVQPSELEGFCLTAMEAAFQGLPLVLSRTGVHEDCVETGVNGYLFDPGDGRALREKIARVLAVGAHRREEMGAASLDLVGERFEEGRVMPQIEAVLEAALHGRPLPESGALSRAPLVEMRPPGKRDA
jgi:glycosyltransferase involved in cell wall biosynthesis